MGEEFTLAPGHRFADGKYSTKRADSEDGTVYWLTVTGGYVKESSDTGELLVSRGVPAEARVVKKHDTALCEATRIHFGWARSDGVHALQSLGRCYPGLLIRDLMPSLPSWSGRKVCMGSPMPYVTSSETSTASVYGLS